MTRRRGAFFAALGAGALQASTARAFEGQVRAETAAQAWQVRGPSGAPVLSLRRLTQTLSLGAWQRPEDPRGAVWTVRARLRIDSDFGGACDASGERCLGELERSRTADFAPLFARRAVDLPFAYIDAQGLLRRAVDLRVGRQFVVDPLGFFVFDGARVQLHLGARARVELYGGLETRTGFPLSSGRFERDGLQRADRAGWDPTLAPNVQDRAQAGAAGLAVTLTPTRALHARATWRRVWTRDGTAEEKLGGSVELQTGAYSLVTAEAVYSVPHNTVGNLSVGLEYAPPERASWGVELSRFRPTFDATSLWASFWTDPTDDLRGRLELPLGARWTLVASALARRYALGETAPDRGVPADRDAFAGGGGLGLLHRRSRAEGSLRARAETGGAGSRGGLDLTASWWARPGRIRLDGGASLWAVEDALRDTRMVSVAVLVGAMVRLGRVAEVSFNLEEDTNPVVGARLRATGILRLLGPF
ncbi:MAG: hypothetical protein HY909_07530 [Deltaproteobacteria bacterium]|nr:hypothetical protein [Deltaproteobacteria bacterium]